jgi:epoxide hydrolase-like predicted phosphatase
MYRAVIFDLGGVVYPSPLEPLSKLRHLDWKLLSPALSSLEKGEVNRDEFIQRTFNASGKQVIEAIEQQIAQPNLTMIDVIDTIRARGIKVGFITNDWQTCFNESISKIQHRADSLIRSHQVGMRKPESAIFTKALTELSVHPDECIFLDDIGQNLNAAKQLGLHTIRCLTKNVTAVDEAALKRLENALGFDVCQLKLYQRIIGMLSILSQSRST